MTVHRSFRELKDSTLAPSSPRAEAVRRAPARYVDSGKIIDENPDADINAYAMRDGQALVGSGAHEPMGRPGRGVPCEGDRPAGRPGRKPARPSDAVSPTGGPLYPDHGPAWLEGVNAGTQVQHSPGKLDQADVGRPRPITY